MVKQIILILAFICLAACQTQTLTQTFPLPATPFPVTNYNDPAFLRAVTAVVRDHPELSAWTPYNATIQIVTGRIYNFYLQSPYDSSTAYASVFDSLQAQTVLTFYLWPQPQTPLPPPTQPPSGYRPFTDYKNASFQRALAQAKKQDCQLFVNYQLTGTELLVSERFYYFRLAFNPRQNFYPARSKLVECIGFQVPVIRAPLLAAAGVTTLNVSNPAEFYEAYWVMVKSFSYLVRYDIVSVSKQSVPGTVYYFELEKTYDAYEKISATVRADLQGRYEVTIIQNDKSLGYSQEVIEQLKLLAEQTWPELQTFRFSIATNINEDLSGLRLTYRNSGGVAKYVDLAITNNKETFNLYSY